MHFFKNGLRLLGILFFLECPVLGQPANAPLQRLVGTVRNADGPLAYVSIRLQGTGLGTLSNAEGHYALDLPHGTHVLVYQALGYKTEQRTVAATALPQTIDLTLEPQPLRLAEAVVGNREDPARAIMRRAIAKAPLERLKVKSYTAEVYIKGGAKLSNIPWLLEGRLKKEGITENTVFFTETRSALTYRAPNFYKNKALSVRSNMDKLGGSVASPSAYISRSFYMPFVGDAVSPLAPNAFNFYRFTYEGIFTDGTAEVNKIRVQPKQRGDDVFEGYIYILEGAWCLHSLNLTTRHEGVTMVTNQLYTPVQNVWMPSVQKYNFVGNVLGFEFEANYIASLRNYNLVVDTALAKPLEIVDERQDRAAAQTLRTQERRQSSADLAKALADTGSSKKLTRKALRRATKALLRAQKATEKAKNNGDEVVAQDSTVLDSLAYKRDDAYWAAHRLVPLTEQEVASTLKLDSLAQIKKHAARKDSLQAAVANGTARSSSAVSNFLNTLTYGRLWYLTAADTSVASRHQARHLARHHRLRLTGIMNPDATSNTVEGYVFTAKLRYQYYRPNSKTQSFRDFSIGPKARYQVARQAILPLLEAEYRYAKGSLQAQGGRYVSQINSTTGISPITNGLASLLFERNYMRLYQKDYVRLEAENFFADRLQLNSYAEWALRYTLENAQKRAFINWQDRSFAPNNADANAYAGTTNFGRHRAALLGVAAIYTPFVRYRIANGQRSHAAGAEPYFHFKTHAGLPQVGGSSTHFWAMAAGIEQSLRLGIRGKLLYYAEAGAFLVNKQSYMPDFFHFEGNRTFLIVGDGLRAFRHLPYYYYSTPVRYAQQHAVLIPRRFLLSRIGLLEHLGWKETLGYHGLTTPGQAQYTELTYGLDGLYRIGRIEGVAVFKGLHYQQVVLRIGLSLKGFSPKLRRKTASNTEADGQSVSIRL